MDYDTDWYKILFFIGSICLFFQFIIGFILTCMFRIVFSFEFLKLMFIIYIMKYTIHVYKFYLEIKNEVDAINKKEQLKILSIDN